MSKPPRHALPQPMGDARCRSCASLVKFPCLAASQISSPSLLTFASGNFKFAGLTLMLSLFSNVTAHLPATVSKLSSSARIPLRSDRDTSPSMKTRAPGSIAASVRSDTGKNFPALGDCAECPRKRNKKKQNGNDWENRPSFLSHQCGRAAANFCKKCNSSPNPSALSRAQAGYTHDAGVYERTRCGATDVFGCAQWRRHAPVVEVRRICATDFGFEG